MKLTLTPRGRKAGAAARAAILEVDKELRSRIGSVRVDQAREALSELIRMQGGGAVASGSTKTEH